MEPRSPLSGPDSCCLSDPYTLYCLSPDSGVNPNTSSHHLSPVGHSSLSCPAGPRGMFSLHRMSHLPSVGDTLGGHTPLALRQGLLEVVCLLGRPSLLAHPCWEGTISYFHLPGQRSH